jgi:hypothetical protein
MGHLKRRRERIPGMPIVSGVLVANTMSCWASDNERQVAFAANPKKERMRPTPPIEFEYSEEATRTSIPSMMARDEEDGTWLSDRNALEVTIVTWWLSVTHLRANS